jgi:hypothetical protein
LTVLGDDAIDLGLLQHDLRDEHAIGRPGVAPGQVAPVARVPGEEPSLEATHGGARRRSHARMLAAGPPGVNAGVM